MSGDMRLIIKTLNTDQKSLALGPHLIGVALRLVLDKFNRCYL